MPIYTKKPETIEAIQWTGENTKDVIAFGPWYDIWLRQNFHGDGVPIQWLLVVGDEANKKVAVGDYIAKDQLGDPIVIRKAEFERLYTESAG